ncbi:hypothetical protein GYMLUDRAFT_67493 [Collybiopsis luxurians FD-317 M1]|nr:hypothetical protein GYMLUDRAFT_67493 [Collybiopsis luxurians FD-317 M1]
MPSSDSEDEDYVPEVEADSSSSDSEEEELPDSKRPRTEPEDPEAEQRRRKELWKAFQDSVTSGSDVSTSKPVEELVKVEKRYMFAGKEVKEIVQVPANSADAKKWPVIPPDTSTSTSTTPPPAPKAITNPPSAAESSTSINPSSSSQKLPASRKGPRKSKVTLGEIPKSSSGSALKKLTVLEKSAMDWNAHVSEKDSKMMKDELEANRKQGGGGYLEKVEFLDRVSERRENLLDPNKNGKRRRG